MSDIKDAGALIKLVYQGMKNAGLNADEVIRRIGLKEHDMADSNLRTPHSAQALFWSTLEDVSGDPDIGLHIAEHLPVYKGQILEYLFLSSPTFGEGLKRALNYQRLLSDAARSEYWIEGEHACITTAFSENPPIRHLNETVTLGLIEFFRYVTDNNFTVTSVDFSHGSETAIEEYEKVFHCPVRFNQPSSRIFFDPEVLNYHSEHAEPELLQLHEQLASEHVLKLEKQDLIGRVNRIIGEVLETGNINLEIVATRLDLKPRLLRNRLTEAGTNFNQVLADYRCNLAKRLLSKTNETIDEIVYLTGFSEPSTFYRAFKRWTGDTPIEYRKGKVAKRMDQEKNG